MKKLKLEIQNLASENAHYACRPAGQIGTCGNYPFLWSVCIGSTPEQAEAKFRAVYSKQIAIYERPDDMFQAVLIPVDGDLKIHEVEGYKDLQSLVEGNIQLIELNKKMTAYINEEGKIFNLPLNSRATHLCRQNSAIFESDYIVGPMIILGPVQDDGDDSSLDPALIRDLFNTYE
jgi:hypothetical protein